MSLHRIVFSLLLGVSLYGMDFSEFYKEALKNSPYLKGNALELEAAKEEGKIATRYKNPSLELEYSQFDAENGSSESGERISLSQPIRLWGVGDATEAVSKEVQSRAKSAYTLTRANFSKKLLDLYVLYKRDVKISVLAHEASDIAKHIYEISKERFENGTIAKADMIQAKLDYKLSLAKQHQAELAQLGSYYELLRFAGFKKEVQLDDSYSETLLTSQKVSNPLVEYHLAASKLAKSKEQLYSNKIQWMSLYAEYEGEPSDDIYRIGVNIPIALFNTKKEERTKAMIEARQAKLLAENTQRSLDIKLIALNKERALQHELVTKLQEGLKEGAELLKLFEEGYKIANVDIVQLQQVKSALIKTKASLIDAKAKLELNIIETNYLQGKYND